MSEAETEGVVDEELKLAGFYVGAGLYGIEIMRIKEVIQARHLPVRPVPFAPAIVEGVIQLRGVVIPVVDLRRRFDSPIDVLPVPGGPISVRMTPERRCSFMPRSVRSLRTARYSVMRRFTSSSPSWSASKIPRAWTGSRRSSDRFAHGTAISQSR